MTDKSLFDFDDYKAFLRWKWEAEGARSGVKQKAAAYINCQTTYVSQVLNKHAHFSLEQADRLNKFLHHTDEESHFFLLLVQKARAGTRELGTYFDRQIDEIKKRRSHMAGRLNADTQITEQMQSEYYSRWIPLAIHVAVAIPELQTREALCEYFDLDVNVVQTTLDFLIRAGAIKLQGNRYLHHQGLVHLSHKSPLVLKHHTNWRLEAMKALDRNRETDLSYSVVYSLSREDAEKIIKKFVDVIDQNLKLIAPSKEEVLYCNTIDFFEVRGGGHR